MNENTIKALNDFHEAYKAKFADDVKVKNKEINVNKGSQSIKPWDCISDVLRVEFMELADHAVIAEHHKEGFIKSDDAVRYSVWENFKAARGLK